MDLKVQRIWNNKEKLYCGGKWFVNGKFFAFSIEDYDRGLLQSMSLEEIAKIKIHGKTAIPKGKYEVTMTYSNRFKRFMVEVLNVKGFAGIRMHVANKAGDVEGCIGAAYEDSSDGFAGNSAKAAAKLEKDIEAAIKKEKVWLTVE